MRNNTYTFDEDLLLKAAGAVVESTNGSTIIDLGAGFVEGVCVIDVSAIVVAGGDELYELILVFSNTANMETGKVAGPCLKLGDSSVNEGDSDSEAGRYELRFQNEINGTVYRYCRIRTVITTGTDLASINYSAFLTKG